MSTDQEQVQDTEIQEILDFLCDTAGCQSDDENSTAEPADQEQEGED